MLTKVKGFRTVILGAFVAIAPALLTYVGGIDWTSLGISPATAAIIGTAIVAVRAITNTSIGAKE